MINQKNISFYLKILAAIVVSFLLAGLLSQKIFLAGSPRLRQDLGNYLLSQIKGFSDNISSYFTAIFKRQPQRQPLEFAKPASPDQVPYQPIAKGVYAKQVNGITYKLYQMEEISWLEYRFEYRGKIYTIKYAPSDSPPNGELIKKLLDQQNF